MSANIWSDSTANMTIRSDGTYLAGKAGTAELISNVTGLASLTDNQTIHIGASLKGAGAGVLKPFVEYKDAAGNLNWVGFPSWQTTDSWQRFEGTCVVPSGMTVCSVGFNSSEATGDIEVSNPVFNYGSTGIVMAAGSVTVASINDGVAGKDGVGISSTDIAYAKSTSGTTTPTSGWQSTIPSPTPGQYLWTKTVWHYTDNTTETGYSVAMWGAKGDKGDTGNDGVAGKDGVGISSTDIAYQGSSSGTTAPTGTWTATVPSVAQGDYLWTRMTWHYTDNTSEIGYSVARIGEKGATGATGATGTGVSSIKPQYYLSTSSTTQTGGSWSDTCPAWVSGEYYWTRNYITWSDGTTTTTTPVLDDASNTANQTASDAKDTATTLSTLVRESSSGVDVGKSTDGSNYSTAVARVGSDGAFHVLSSALTELASYGAKLVEIGKNSTSAVIKFCGGLAQISAMPWYREGATYTGIGIRSAYGTSILAGTNTSIAASVEATQFAAHGRTGGAVTLNGSWLGAYNNVMNQGCEVSMSDVIDALEANSTVHRSAGILTANFSTTMHYTKIGTWSGTSDADILKLRVMTGDGYNGRPNQNSEIDIFIKDAWQSSNSTTSAYGVTYELHNASSDVLSAYVIATAYNSCDIWIKNPWGLANGWYVAEYNGGVWLGDGSWHQRGTPSGTSQNATCIDSTGTYVLYNGGAALTYDTAPGAGTNGDVTLSETAANFVKLIIYYRTDQYEAVSSLEVVSPDGKNISMFTCTTASGAMVIRGCIATISGKYITPVSGGQGWRTYWSNGTASAGTDKYIYITRVEGIR